MLPLAGFAQVKFGVVDVDEILKSMPEVESANQSLNEASAMYDAEFKKLQDDYQRKFTDFQNLKANTPETIRQRRVQEMQEVEQSLTQFRQTATHEMEKLQRSLMDPIYSRIEQAIQAVGQEEGFVVIFKKDATMYVNYSVTDVTSLVKLKLSAN